MMKGNKEGQCMKKVFEKFLRVVQWLSFLIFVFFALFVSPIGKLIAIVAALIICPIVTKRIPRFPARKIVLIMASVVLFLVGLVIGTDSNSSSLTEGVENSVSAEEQVETTEIEESVPETEAEESATETEAKESLIETEIEESLLESTATGAVNYTEISTEIEMAKDADDDETHSEAEYLEKEQITSIETMGNSVSEGNPSVTGNTGIDGSFALAYLSSDEKRIVDYAISAKGMNYVYNWEYPESYKADRNKVFELTKKLKDSLLQISFYSSTDPNKCFEIDGVVGLKFKDKLMGDGYFYVENTEDVRDYLYYGEIKNDKPNGLGVIFNYNGLVYGGYFKNGVATKYGAKFSPGTDELVWECTKPSITQVAKKERFLANGKGITYHHQRSDWMKEDGSAARYLFWSNIGYELEEYSAEYSDVKFPSTVIQKATLTLQPMVEYEGELKDSEPKKKGTYYNDKYELNGDFYEVSNDGSKLHDIIINSDTKSCYGAKK